MVNQVGLILEPMRTEPRVKGRLGRGMAVALVAVGSLTVGCVETADLLDAALMKPVLTESFEAPIVEGARTYAAGQAFTTGHTTWDVMAGVLELYNAQSRPDTAVFDGHQAIRLTGAAEPGLIAVTFPTIPKRQYTMTFHYGHRTLQGGSAGRARVEVIGAGTTLLEAEFDPLDQTFRSYRRYSGTFAADSERTTLRFTSPAGPHGVTLDGISVLTVPPPPPIPPTPYVR